jgi:hypothetical protein
MPTEQDRQGLERLLNFLIRSVPDREPPPFFASRVARLALIERASLATSLQAFSRRLVPVFMTLLLAVCFVVYRSSELDPLLESELFSEYSDSIEPITIGDVLTLLGPESGTEDENK